MPVIECHLLEGYSDEDKKRLGVALTDASRLVIPAMPESVTVMIHEMPSANYLRGRTTRNPAPALPDPCKTVKAFLTHLENRDLDAVRDCVSDDFVMFFPNTGAMQDFDALVQWAASRYQRIEKTIDAIEALHSGGDATVVYCRGTLSGVWHDDSPFHGIRFIDRFELIDGKITRQEVWNDLAEVRAAL